MGRLTLNILLSFAQFEREVTAERIRDKIAASKQKGMWMGGTVPLGYDVKDRKLVIDPDEAETVRIIFRRYMELGSVFVLKVDLEQSGLRTKLRQSANGVSSGGVVFSRGNLYWVLSNPIYIGKIRHKEVYHPGLHDPIIDQNLWDAVQAKLAGNSVRRARRPMATESSLLMGKLFDQTGERLTPSHAIKKGRRYRYYVSRSLIVGQVVGDNRGWRIPASDLEQAVANFIGSMLTDRNSLSIALTDAGIGIGAMSACWSRAHALKQKIEKKDGDQSLLADLVQRVEISEDGLGITMSLAPIVGDDSLSDKSKTPVIIQAFPMRIQRRGVELRLIIKNDITPNSTDPALIKSTARARSWWHDLSTGAMPSIAAIAKRDGVSEGYVGHVLPLAFLAPSIAEAFVTGNHPPALTVESLVKRTTLPLSWDRQRTLLGFE